MRAAGIYLLKLYMLQYNMWSINEWMNCNRNSNALYEREFFHLKFASFKFFSFCRVLHFCGNATFIFIVFISIIFFFLVWFHFSNFHLLVRVFDCSYFSNPEAFFFFKLTGWVKNFKGFLVENRSNLTLTFIIRKLHICFFFHRRRWRWIARKYSWNF